MDNKNEDEKSQKVIELRLKTVERRKICKIERGKKIK